MMNQIVGKPGRYFPLPQSINNCKNNKENTVDTVIPDTGYTQLSSNTKVLFSVWPKKYREIIPE
jgi:hypothetical protein